MQYDLPALHKQLLETYSDDELRTLCFELEIDYEIIEGANKSARARELLTYLKRRERIPELILKCRQQRPANEWNLIRSQQTQSEEFRQQLGLDTSVRSQYLDLQFEIYRSVWQSLYALKEAGDRLWELATKENIANFATLLRQARALTGANAILFDQGDYEALMQLFDRFGVFEAGKARMVEIRSEAEERMIVPEQAQRQIRKNGQLKTDYEVLLDRVRQSFGSKIAQLGA
jgi:hypothetical protein